MAADDKMSTDFTGESAAGESKSSRRLKMIGGVIFVVGVLLSLAVNSIDLRPNFEDRRATEAAQAAARTEQIALARAQVNEELLLFSEGTWYFQGHTRETEREVYIDTPIVVDQNGKIKEFGFDNSFVSNDTHYANTWQCEATQLNRYDCSITQRYEGGRWRGEGNLTRESETLFSGRYLFENQWYPVSLVMKNE